MSNTLSLQWFLMTLIDYMTEISWIYEKYKIWWKHLYILLSFFVGQEELQGSSCCSVKTCLVVLLRTRSLICIGTMCSSAGCTACKLSQLSTFWKHSKTSIMPCHSSKLMRWLESHTHQPYWALRVYLCLKRSLWAITVCFPAFAGEADKNMLKD